MVLDMENSLLKFMYLYQHCIYLKDSAQESENVDTICELTLFEPSPMQAIDDAFLSYPVVARMTIKSKLLKEGIACMDESCTQLEITFSTLEQTVSIMGSGNAGETFIEYEQKALESFFVDRVHVLDEQGLPIQDPSQDQNVTFCYQTEKWRSCLKTLAKSERTQIKINNRGILLLQVPYSDHV